MTTKRLYANCPRAWSAKISEAARSEKMFREKWVAKMISTAYQLWIDGAILPEDPNKYAEDTSAVVTVPLSPETAKQLAEIEATLGPRKQAAALRILLALALKKAPKPRRSTEDDIDVLDGFGGSWRMKTKLPPVGAVLESGDERVKVIRHTGHDSILVEWTDAERKIRRAEWTTTPHPRQTDRGTWEAKR
jgi:hypothetical protein